MIHMVSILRITWVSIKTHPLVDLHPDSCTSDLLRYIDQATRDEMISFADSVAQQTAQQ